MATVTVSGAEAYVTIPYGQAMTHTEVFDLITALLRAHDQLMGRDDAINDRVNAPGGAATPRGQYRRKV